MMKNWNKTKPVRPGYIAGTTGDKAILKKVRSKTNQDIYYTYSNWATNEIDGVTFLPVVKEMPDPKKQQVIHYMKKDNMEYVK
jgi:hypothetical protein